MNVEFRLADLGEGITEAEIVRCLVVVGESVQLDQTVLEVQTDKAVVQMPAPVAGTVVQIAVREGQVVHVGDLLIIFGAANTAATPATTPLPPVRESFGIVGTDTGTSTFGGMAAALAAWSRPPDSGEQTINSTGTLPPPRSTSHAQRPRAIPAVRHLARALGIDLATVHGSGIDGRILRNDVQRVSQSTSPSANDHHAPPEDDSPTAQRIPLRGLRRRIAENMARAAAIPQVTSMVEADARQLVALRAALLPLAEQRAVRLSYLPLIIKAVVQTLRQHPYLNASLDDAAQEIVLHSSCHMGIATATPDGLLVPVLRHADQLSIFAIATNSQHLAEEGRARRLPPAALRGSTFTISNYGALGGYFATPLLNPGEAAILGLGQIAERPLVRDGSLLAAATLPLCLTADHRIVDGDAMSRFMSDLVSLLENPLLLMADLR